MAVPPAVIDEIRNRADILDVISDYVSLKKTGRNWTGLCPFHPDKKSPSFSVSPEKGLFYCFGCGAGGDVFGFLRRIENISFMEAVEKLAKRYGIEIPRRPLTEKELSEKEDRERLAQLLEESCAFYHRLLTKDEGGEEGRRYLKKRGVDIELAKTFLLGWAPRQGDALYKHLLSFGFKVSDMESAGLVSERDGGGYYDRFRGRVMFPIISVQERVLGFGGRVVSDDDAPKYMNSPESPLYQKSKVLFGLHTAHRAIREKDFAIIVEGYFDVLALFKAGFQNAVAPCGTALTPEQVRIIRRYTSNIFPLFDTDEAGEKARMKALEVILNTGASAKYVTLKEAKDPDEFFQKHDAGAFLRLLEGARPLVEVAFERIVSSYGTSVEGRLKALKATASLLATMSDINMREMYLREFASRLSVGGVGAEDILRKEMASASARSEGEVGRIENKPEKGTMGDLSEYYLIVLLLTKKELESMSGQIEEVAQEMEDTELAEIARKVAQNGVPSSPSAYMESLESSKSALLSKLILEEPEETSGEEIKEKWFETVKRVRLRNFKRRKEEIQAKLANASEEEMVELLRQKKEILERERILKEEMN